MKPSKTGTELTLTVKIRIAVSMWDAIKLRIGGATISSLLLEELRDHMERATKK